MATDLTAIIEAIDAAILAMIAGGGAQKVREADGREIEYTDLEQLTSARSKYKTLADTTSPNSLRISPIKFGDTM